MALYYRSVGYRRAENLRQYSAFETDRFVRYYDDSIGGAAVVLASATANIP